MAADWKNITLGDFVTLQRGHDLTADERKPGNVPVMGAAGQNGFHDTAIAKAPGVVIGRSGGSYGQVHFAASDFWPHNTALYVTDFKGNDPYFAYHLLKWLDFDSFNSGSAQPSLNRNFIYPIKIRVPSPNDQQRIAAVLSALDAKIELNQRLNAELEGMAKLLYDYWFVQYDFPLNPAQAAALRKPHLTGKPYRSSGGPLVYNEQLKREIPMGWTASSIAELAVIGKETINPADYPQKPFKLFSIPGFDQTGAFTSEIGSSIGSNKFVVEGSDILVSKLNPWTNRVIYPSNENDMICSTEFVVLKSHSAWMKNYLFMLTRDPQFIGYCSQSATGTSNSHKRVNPNVMTAYALPFEQQTAQQFGELLQPILSKRLVLGQQSNHLAQLRDWLLPMLMNGQVRVG